MDATMLMTALKMVVALGVVLLCFGGSVWLFKRVSGRSNGWLKRASSDAAKPLEILSSRNLGPGRGIYLIRCMDKKFLIGATQQNISLIGGIEEEDENAFQQALQGEMPKAKREEFERSIKGSLKEISRV